MSESRLVYEIMQELGRHGAIFRTNAGTHYTKDGKPISGLPKGFTDLLFIGRDGRASFVECKTDKGKPTPEQVKFIEKMREHNCNAGIARSVADAVAICGIV